MGPGWRGLGASGNLRRHYRGDGPQVAGLGEADDAGSEAAVAVAPHRHSAGLYHQDPGLTPARPGVHSADINEPAAKDPVGIVGILRFFFGARRRCACDVSTMDTDKPSDLFPRLIVAPRTVTLPRRPARASVS